MLFKGILKSRSLAAGLALFTMFFGAGNLIFPLALGHFAADQTPYAMMGLVITGVIVPFLGVVAIMLYDGCYKSFFSSLGKWPGFLISLIIIALIGPLGCTPRCIALSYSTVKAFFPGVSPSFFNIFSCLFIFLFTLKKNRTMDILGRVLSPILLLGLGFMIVMGFITPSDIASQDASKFSLFVEGLKEGYNTMDLLAAFFFSSTMISMLKNRSSEESKGLFVFRALKAAAIGALLLGGIYFGFGHIASLHSDGLQFETKEQILTALAMKVAGPYAGIVLCATVVLTCLTTAIALICVFVDFLQKRIFNHSIDYEYLLVASLLITFAVSNFEFQGICKLLFPIMQICYPSLIVLSIVNIASRFVCIKKGGIFVMLTFLCSLIFYFM